MAFFNVTTLGSSTYQYRGSLHTRKVRLPLKDDFEEILTGLKTGATDPEVAKVKNHDIEKLSGYPLKIEFDKAGALGLYKLWYEEYGMKHGFHPVVTATCTETNRALLPKHWLWNDLGIDRKFKEAEALGKVSDLTDSDDRSVDQKFKDAKASGEMIDLSKDFEDFGGAGASHAPHLHDEFDYFSPNTMYPYPNPGYPQNLWALNQTSSSSSSSSLSDIFSDSESDAEEKVPAPEDAPSSSEEESDFERDFNHIEAGSEDEDFEDEDFEDPLEVVPVVRRSSRRPVKRRRLTYTGWGAEHKEVSEF